MLFKKADTIIGASQPGLPQWKATSTDILGNPIFAITQLNELRDVYIAGNQTTTENLVFLGELMPDGIECSVNQIIKKINDNNWQCVDFPASAAGSKWTVIENAIYNNTSTDTVLIGKFTVEDFEKSLEIAGSMKITGAIYSSSTAYITGMQNYGVASTTGKQYVGGDLEVDGKIPNRQVEEDFSGTLNGVLVTFTTSGSIATSTERVSWNNKYLTKGVDYTIASGNDSFTLTGLLATYPPVFGDELIINYRQP